MTAIRFLLAGAACMAIAACDRTEDAKGPGIQPGAEKQAAPPEKQPIAIARQDPSAPPAFGSVELDSGFTPDPHTVVLTAGGSLEASALGASCTGMTAEAPDFDLYYTAGDYPLSIYATSDADTTLVINTPSGEWVCADDVDGLNPSITFARPDSGLYDIWVGSFDGQPQATLFITELDAGTAMAGATPQVGGAPTYGAADLAAGFAPDPHTVSLTAGGSLDASRLGAGCVGKVASVPDYVLNYTPGDFPLYITSNSAADTTLAVNLPDGSWVCDDDGGALGSNPLVTLTTPPAGRYDIFVGTYDEQPVAATLMITELEGQ